MNIATRCSQPYHEKNNFSDALTVTDVADVSRHSACVVDKIKVAVTGIEDRVKAVMTPPRDTD